MSAPQAPQAPLPGAVPAAQGEPAGRWQWAAYPGQEPQWYWFPDPTPPAAGPAVPARPDRPDVWGDFRRRARRMGFLLLVLGFVAAGAVAYGGLTGDGAEQQIALDVDGDPADPALEPVPDAGPADPGAPPEPPQDEFAPDVAPDVAPDAAPEAEAPPGEADPEQPVLDELADTLRTRAQAATDAMLGGDSEAALEYIDPSCREAVRAPMESAVAAAQAAFTGVRMVVSSVTVTTADGKVVYRVEGEPSEAAAEFAVATEEMPELWVHRDGHWYRDIAECRVAGGTS